MCKFSQDIGNKLIIDKLEANLMDQYYPAHKAYQHPSLDKRITQAEYKEALEWAL
jgi:uncharacterized Fe-S radical SAM superfamily protein PflX